jgi:hypothetical protein
MIYNFKEFSQINEGRSPLRRSYGETPSKFAYTGAKMRNAILSFVKEKDQATVSEMAEFMNSMSEDIGKAPHKRWLERNSHLVKYYKNQEGPDFYKLTKLGEKVLNNTSV